MKAGAWVSRVQLLTDCIPLPPAPAPAQFPQLQDAAAQLHREFPQAVLALKSTAATESGGADAGVSGAGFPAAAAAAAAAADGGGGNGEGAAAATAFDGPPAPARIDQQLLHRRMLPAS